MLAVIAKTSAKSLATFLVWLLFFMICITLAPGIITKLQDAADAIEGAVRTPEFLDAQKLFVWRIVSDGNVIMGVFTTLIARSIVEIGAYICGSILSSGDDPDDDAPVVEGSKFNYDA